MNYSARILFNKLLILLWKMWNVAMVALLETAKVTLLCDRTAVLSLPPSFLPTKEPFSNGTDGLLSCPKNSIINYSPKIHIVLGAH
jgi:hypothetical protein